MALPILNPKLLHNAVTSSLVFYSEPAGLRLLPRTRSIRGSLVRSGKNNGSRQESTFFVNRMTGSET